jgi:hypothetical protein
MKNSKPTTKNVKGGAQATRVLERQGIHMTSSPRFLYNERN